jgi:hypothetical protein
MQGAERRYRYYNNNSHVAVQLKSDGKFEKSAANVFQNYNNHFLVVCVPVAFTSQVLLYFI